MKKIIAAFLFLLSFVLNAQAPKKFYTRFGGYGHDIGYGVVQTLNGQYAVTGSTSSFGNGNTDVYLALVDSMGWVRWEKSYGGFNNDIGRSIIQLKDSGFVIAGYTNSFGSGGYDVFAVRTDKNGNLIWQKAFGGFDWDFGYCVKESNGGDSLIICGNTYSFGYGKSDGYIIKTDINGNFQWQKTYGGAEDDEFKSFTLTYNNQYAFAGTTKSMGDTKGDCWLMKTNLGGDSILGVKRGDSKIQFLTDIVEANNFDLVMSGANDIDGRDTTYGYLLSLDNNGGFKYENTFPRSEKYNDFQLTTLTKGYGGNNFIYVYKTYEAPINSKVEPLFMDVNGMWPSIFNTYGSLDNDNIVDISNTKGKGYIAVGSTNGFGSQLTDVFLVKLDSTLFGSQKIVGIKENKVETLSVEVYPTVTKDFVYVNNSTKLNSLDISVISITGSLIFTVRQDEKSNRLDLTQVPDGLYFVQISSPNQQRTFKVIKSN